jgi:hypothetical protein
VALPVGEEHENHGKDHLGWGNIVSIFVFARLFGDRRGEAWLRRERRLTENQTIIGCDWIQSL